MKPVSAWTHASIRASPRYTLVDADRLPDEQRARMPHVRDGDRLLRPGEPDDGWHVVGSTAAALFGSLSRPRPVAAVRPHIEDERLIPRLVLEGILEVETGGRFLGGPAAYPVLFAPSAAASRSGPRDRTAELSEEALRYGEALRLEDARTLAGRLYGYNALPLTPDQAARLGDHDAVREFLGVAAHEPLTRTGRNGGDTIIHSRDDAWLSWHGPESVPDGSPVFKLYVSPVLHHLPDAFRAVAVRFEERGPFAFKVGASLGGLLRPDKLVLYFTSRGELERFARSLAGDCDGLAAHGVPFTGGLSEDGLLSWGMDPPKSSDGTWWGGESWRVWLTAALARAIVAARRAGLRGISPAEYARARLRLEGVDPVTWAPCERT